MQKNAERAARSYVPFEDFTMAASVRPIEAAEFMDSIDLKPFNSEQLQQISAQYTEALKNGLSKESPSSLKMIPTQLEKVDFSDLRVDDEALVIEVGGTKVRRAIVKIGADHKPVIKQDAQGNFLFQEEKISKIQYESVDEFYTEVLKGMESIMEGNKPKAVGMVFSFPADAEKTDEGVDVRAKDKLTKGFSVKGISKDQVGKVFMKKLKTDRYVMDDLPITVLNDTPAVMLATGARIGGVVGTGFNLAILANGRVINTESGGFDQIPVSEVAYRVDKLSENRGQQLAEKQISGKYLEEALNLLIPTLELSGWVEKRMADEFTTDFISRVLKDEKSKVEKDLQAYIDGHSYQALVDTARRLSVRSAQLVGTMIGTAMKTFLQDYPEQEIEIPIEGSVYWGIPGYRDLVEKIASEMSGKSIRSIPLEHAGILGAAAAALSQIKQ